MVKVIVALPMSLHGYVAGLDDGNPLPLAAGVTGMNCPSWTTARLRRGHEPLLTGMAATPRPGSAWRAAGLRGCGAGAPVFLRKFLPGVIPPRRWVVAGCSSRVPVRSVRTWTLDSRGGC